MVSREQLREMSKWTGFLGTITIISGVLSAIGGLFAFVIGAIPGIITIILGVKLRNTKKYADQVINSETTEGQEVHVTKIFESLTSYFKILGILAIIGIIFSIISLLGFLVGGLELLSTLSSF